MKTLIRSILSLAFLRLLIASPQAQAVTPTPDGCYPNYTTAEGCNALQLLGSGAGNTGIGWYALFSAGDSNFNTAVGSGTLALNNGNANTAVGAATLLLNTTGQNNTAIGTNALLYNGGGTFNNAFGAFALFNNLDGVANNAFGDSALGANTSGSYNTAIGYAALNNTNGNDMGIGNDNIAVGTFTLYSNTSGSGNTAIGNDALGASTIGSFNVAIGFDAGLGVYQGSNIICIGAEVAGEDVNDTTWIGNVYGVATQGGTTAPVVVSDTGQLGTIASSERFKKNIATMDKASEAILALRPVTFRYKSDSKGMPQFGLIAEEVAKVNRTLVLPDKEGKPYTVRYDAVNVMLLNEFLKEHRKREEQDCKIQDQETTIAELRSEIRSLVATVNEHASELQRVSARLQINKAAAHEIVGNQ